MKKFKLLIGGAALCGCVLLSSCGKETFDVTETVQLTFNGYDGYGTCALEGEYEWIDDIMDWYGDSLTNTQKLSCERELKEVVEYSIDAEDGLSNGDTVTVSVKIGKAAEDYAFILKSEDITFTVDGLDEIQEIDPFENVEVVFEGKSPNGKAVLNNSSNDYAVTYTLDKSDGLSNGDAVTVTADFSYGMDEEKYAQQYGKKLSATETAYIVEGLASYPAAIEEISTEMQEKMAKQAEDAIRAHCSGWKEGNSLASLEPIGNYYLTVKAGFNANPNNRLYYVFKVTANMTGLYEEAYANGDDSIHTGIDEYYTYVYFDEIVNLPDGTTSVDLSRNELCSNSCNSNYGYANFFGTSHYTFNGYKDLDTMFNDCITSNIEKYNYVNTVK